MLFPKRLTGLLCALVLTVGSASLLLAQSGRGRPTAPPPKPTPRPNTPAVLNLPEGGRLARQDVEGATTRYVLRNGLTIVIRERHSTPLAAAAIQVKAGTLSEREDETGLAQLVSRAILKGTASRPVGEIEKETQRLGGHFRTFVDYDQASFRITVPAESLPSALELQADLLTNPAFPDAELKKAAGETIRAGRRFQDQAAASALDRLYATAFTVHPLRRSRYGSEEAVSAFTRDQIVAFYEQHYQPQNTVIAISGDVIPSQLIGRIQQTFGKWGKAPAAATQPKDDKSASPARSAPARTANAQPPASTKTSPDQPPTSTKSSTAQTPAAPDQASGATKPGAAPILQEPAQDKLRYGNTRGDTGQSYITIGYHLPPPATTAAALKERATFEMLAAVLGLGHGSRLAQVLRDGSRLAPEAREKGELASLVTEVEAEYKAWPGAALLAVRMRIDPARIDRAEAEYFREIERFKRELISDGELQRARYLLEKRLLDETESVEDEAISLARAQSLLGDFRHQDALLSRVMRVTAADIQAAAAKYLTLANTSVHEFEPQGAQARTFTPESFAETMTIFAPTLASTVAPDEIKPAPQLRTFKQGEERGPATVGENIIISEAPLPVKDFSIFRGPRAFVREDRSRPTVSIGVFLQGGRLIEDEATSGMTELMLRVMSRGTQTRKSDLIALELESYGGEIHIVNEPDLFGFVLDVLSRNAEPATRLLLDIVENPYFDKAELARAREMLLADQVVMRHRATARAEELLWSSLYPGHPYGLPRLGLPAPVRAATVEQLESWHASTVKRQFPLVVIVGDTDGSALVSRVFSEAFKRSETDKSLKVNLPPLTSPPEEKAEAAGTAQTAQAIGIRTAAAEGNTPSALAILARAAAWRLMTELGAKQGLIDEVIIINDPRLASGAFGAVIASAPELEAKAREALRAEIARLASAPPAEDDFDRGRNAAIGAYAIGLQAHQARAIEYARLVISGRKASDADTQPDLVRAVRQAELKRIAEATLKMSQAGIGIVRPVAAK